jgi:hypothetical protein
MKTGKFLIEKGLSEDAGPTATGGLKLQTSVEGEVPQ